MAVLYRLRLVTNPMGLSYSLKKLAQQVAKKRNASNARQHTRIHG